MDPKSAAEELPALYRALLDRVAQFEAEGRRPAAHRLRTEATGIYSRSWDDRARRRLQDLLRKARDLESTQRGPVRGFRRRSAPVV
jgi:hypothetical protein